MPLGKTEFLPNIMVSYPLDSLPNLFAVIDTVSRKGFFEKIGKLEGPGGEGISPEQYIKMIHVGLHAENPTISYEEAKKLVTKFTEENGQKALEEFIVDAFGDAKLSNKDITDKKKALVKELEELEILRMECMIHSKKEELEAAERRFKEKVADLGNPTKTTPSKTLKKKT